MMTSSFLRGREIGTKNPLAASISRCLDLLVFDLLQMRVGPTSEGLRTHQMSCNKNHGIKSKS